jgi:hypothetical protein
MNSVCLVNQPILFKNTKSPFARAKASVPLDGVHNRINQFNSPIPRFGRGLSTKEFQTLNALGMGASILGGLLAGHLVIGILGIFVAPLPAIGLYIGAKKLMGQNIEMPKVTFKPQFLLPGMRRS